MRFEGKGCEVGDGKGRLQRKGLRNKRFEEKGWEVGDGKSRTYIHW